MFLTFPNPKTPQRPGSALTVLVLLASAAYAQGPSFDCAKANGEIEKLICSDKPLSAMDRKLAAVYAEAVKKQPSGKAPSSMTAEQRGWIKGRNDCWKADDKRACVNAAYTTRIAEVQAKNQLVPSRGPFAFACGSSKPNLRATYFETDPSSAVFSYGDTNVIAFVSPSGSGAKYEGANVTFWEHQGEAQFTWLGKEMTCKRAK